MDENKLSCYLKSQKNVQRFAMIILWKLIKKSIEYGESISTIIEMMTEKYNQNTNELTKPGLSKNLSKKVIQAIKSSDRKIYDKILIGEKNLHSIMGSIYGFLDMRVNKNIHDFVLFLIEGNKKLTSAILRRIKKIFCLPKDMDWNTVKSFIGDTNKNIYFSMVLEAVNCPESSMRRNLNRMSYIRIPNTEEDRSDKYHNDMLVNAKKDKKNCHRDISRNRKALLVTSKYHYKLDNTFFKNVMDHYQQPTIGGPSGSIVILYDFAFSLLGIKPTKENKLLLLAVSIADYVPYYHTLSEILISYSSEIDLGYTIDQDPTEFVLNLLEKYKII